MSNQDFTPSQILNRAIGKEEQAKMMYEIYADKIEDKQGQALLREMAQEELGHKLALEKIDPEKPGTFSAPEISSAELNTFFDKPEIPKEATMQEVIRYAIGEEQDAFAFYKSLTEYATDETLINLLNRLATEEKRHKDKLERMYDDMFQPDN